MQALSPQRPLHRRCMTPASMLGSATATDFARRIAAECFDLQGVTLPILKTRSEPFSNRACSINKELSFHRIPDISSSVVRQVCPWP